MDALEWLKRIGTQPEYGVVRVDLLEDGGAVSGKAVVDQAQLDLFAAQLWAAGQKDLYDAFLEAFPTAKAGRFVGAGD